MTALLPDEARFRSGAGPARDRISRLPRTTHPVNHAAPAWLEEAKLPGLDSNQQPSG